MLSQTAEYALRAILFLADYEGTLLAIPVIAKGTHVPAGYLSKVLQSLRRANLVHSQRGKKGGFMLQRDPENITLQEVISAVHPSRHREQCPLRSSGSCPKYDHMPEGQRPKLCPLHSMLLEMSQSMEKHFSEVSIKRFQVTV
ncbi:MAG: Rrf2 family transcriptional regulator [Deltaproteobacteria bacterium]|nr:Rrf2 family transcriptional regulator [Deltaproteobacteria bacterium]